MPYDIIILAGQSNAEGNGIGETDRPFVPDERILMMDNVSKYGYEKQLGSSYYEGSFVTETANEQQVGDHICGNFALTFAKKYVEAGLLGEGRTLLIVNGTAGGTGFAGKQWGVGNILHTRLVKMINEAKKDDSDRFVAFLWHQGEYDSVIKADVTPENRREIYRAVLTATVNDIRSKVGNASLPFIAGEFVSEWKDKNTAACDAVIAATNDVCTDLGHGKLVFARDLKSNNQAVGNGDDIHFCRDALATLGERYFDAFKEIAGLK